MKIASAEVILTCPGRNYLIVRLETESGIVGWGDATLNGREKAVEAALRYHILPELLERDATRIEDIWQALFRHTYWRGGPVLNSALSGVDMALWDIKGKQAEMPVYELLGGKSREYAAVYQHCGSDSVEAILDRMDRARSRGIEHFRVNLHPPDTGYLDLQAIVRGVKEVREQVGHDDELIVDIHGRADPIEATQIATELESARLYFLEDPVRPEQPRAFEHLRSRSATPLAMGELFTDPWRMVPLIEDHLVDFIRVDLAHVGGITAARKLAAIGEHHYVKTAFHGPGDLSPIGYAATVHLDLTIPNFGIQELTEHAKAYGDPIEEVFRGGANFLKGKGAVTVPGDPGLGIDVDLAAAREYEYSREHLPTPRNPDGSVQDW